MNTINFYILNFILHVVGLIIVTHIYPICVRIFTKVVFCFILNGTNE